MTEVETIRSHATLVFMSFDVQFLASLRVNQIVGFTMSFLCFTNLRRMQKMKESV